MDRFRAEYGQRDHTNNYSVKSESLHSAKSVFLMYRYERCPFIKGSL